LALSFFLLRRHLVDDLLTVLMGGMNSSLLSSKLVFGVLLLGRIVPSAFQSWKEVV
jgi:hypothetical protein